MPGSPSHARYIWPSGYTLPPRLRAAIALLERGGYPAERLSGARRKAAKKGRHSFVRECGAVWIVAACAPLAELVELLCEARTSPVAVAGLKDVRPLQAYCHADLNLANILVDLQASRRRHAHEHATCM